MRKETPACYTPKMTNATIIPKVNKAMNKECTELVCSAQDDLRPYHFEPFIRNRAQLNVIDSESSKIEFEDKKHSKPRQHKI